MLAGVPGQRESMAAWRVALRDLKAHALCTLRLVIRDGHLGIWAGLWNVYPEVEKQRCWIDKILHVLDKLSKRKQIGAKSLFYRFPRLHWKNFRRTNPVESPFAAIRLRTTAAKWFKKVANATSW